VGKKGGRSVLGRRTDNALISGMIFVVVALGAGFITTAFTDSWVWPVVAGAVAGSVAEWVYVAVRWRTGRRGSR